jgi:adenosine deaminase CECR1
LIAGFDMVNEEDYTEQIEKFMPQILAAQRDETSSTFGMPTFCHAGETHDRSINNLHDAILLNTKRIGHGFQLFLFPNLVQECIKKDICIEVCPLSNMVLGYTYDLRNHPIRDLTYKGLQFSISSDDPGFFNYKGVTLDYAYVTLAWELNIRDLKKISLNGIKYSSVSEEKKQHLEKNVFAHKWTEFITYLNSI